MESEVKYFYGDNVVVRKTADNWPGIDIYRGGGDWERILTPEWFFTNADEIDEATANELIAGWDKGPSQPASNPAKV